MIERRFFGYPDYAAYKAAFRQSARRRGIVPEQGATSFQAALVAAETRKATHHERMAALVARDAQRHGPDEYYYYWDSDDPHQRGRVVLRRLRWVHWDGGSGHIDTIKLETSQRRDWWVCSDRWRQGSASRIQISAQWHGQSIQLSGAIRPTDVQAIANVRADAARREGSSGALDEAVADEWRAGKRSIAAPTPQRRKRHIASPLTV